jgi:hypothetical protein
MKDFLKKIYKNDLKLNIDSFIEKKIIYIITSAKKGDTFYVIKVDNYLLPFIEEIKNEFTYIFDDCKVSSDTDSIIIDLS